MGTWQRAGILTLLVAAIIGGGVAYVAVTNRKRGPRWTRLTPTMRRKVNELEQKARSQGLNVMFWDGWRDPSVTIANIKAGTSKLKDPLSGYHTWGEGADIVFRDAMGLPNWPEGVLKRPDGSEYINPQWLKLGKVGESIGLKWGGRWRRLGTAIAPGRGLFDGPHFQSARTVASIRAQWGNNYAGYLQSQGVTMLA